MLLYTLHERPVARAEDRDVVLVKEGFCWPAFVLPLVWGLYRRLWLGVLVYLALVAAAAAVVGLGAVDRVTETALALGLAILVGAEANDWRRRSLARRGYRPRGVVAGADLEMAEERFFKLAAAAPAPRLPPVAPQSATTAATTAAAPTLPGP